MSERPMPESEMAKLEVPDRCPTCGSELRDAGEAYDRAVQSDEMQGGFQAGLIYPCTDPFHQSDTESG